MRELVAALQRACENLRTNYYVYPPPDVQEAIREAVREAQRLLGVTADGIIGPATRAAADSYGSREKDRRLAAVVREEFGIHGCRRLALMLDVHRATARDLIDELRHAAGYSNPLWPREAP